ncbi:uncharacterized protein LOC143041097 [Oratosquilla oratoria]|uniref:uncharacterized protein LOC143041097 n=1 Tax=Oratosquilla oratoria TaxID=337810 RepID=UPI003F774CC6
MLAFVEGNTELETFFENQDFQYPILGRSSSVVDRSSRPRRSSAVMTDGWGVLSTGLAPPTVAAAGASSCKILDQNVGVSGMVFMLSDPAVAPQKSRLNSAGEESDSSMSGSDSGVSSPVVRGMVEDEEGKREGEEEEEREDENEKKNAGNENGQRNSEKKDYVDDEEEEEEETKNAEGNGHLPAAEESSEHYASTIDISGVHVKSRGVLCRVVKKEEDDLTKSSPSRRTFSYLPKGNANTCNHLEGSSGREIDLEWRIIPPIAPFLPSRPCLVTDHEEQSSDFDRSSTPTSFSSAYTVTENGGSTTDLEDSRTISPRHSEEPDLRNFDNHTFGGDHQQGGPRRGTPAERVTRRNGKYSKEPKDFGNPNVEPKTQRRESSSAPDVTFGLQESKTEQDKTFDLSVDLLHCCTSGTQEQKTSRGLKSCRDRTDEAALEEASDTEGNSNSSSFVHGYIPCRDQKEKESEELWVANEATYEVVYEVAYEVQTEDPIPVQNSDPHEVVQHTSVPFLLPATLHHPSAPRNEEKPTQKVTQRPSEEEGKQNCGTAPAVLVATWDKSRPRHSLLRRSLSSPTDASSRLPSYSSSSSSPYSTASPTPTAAAAAAAVGVRDFDTAVWSEQAWRAGICVDPSLCITSLMCAAVASSPPPSALDQQGPRRHYSTRQRANDPDALGVKIVSQEPKWDSAMGSSIKELLASAPNLPTKSSTTNLPTKRFSFILRSNSVKSNNSSSSEGDNEEKEIDGSVSELDRLKDKVVTPSDQAILEKIQELNLKQDPQETLLKLKPKTPSRHPPCRRCGDPVYPAERFEPSMGMPFHGSCFKCAICNVRLTLKTYFRSPLDPRDLRVFCRSHVPSLDPGKVGSLRPDVTSRTQRSEVTSRTLSPESLAKESTAALDKLVSGCLMSSHRAPEVVKCDTIGLRYF